MARHNAKKSVMADIASEVKYGMRRPDTADGVLDNVVDMLREQGEDAFHDGNYLFVLHIIEDLKYIERCTPSLEKYAQKLIDKQGDE